MSSQNQALALFEEYPEMYLPEHRDSILQGRSAIGMSPEESRPAGGPDANKVVADSDVRPDNANPLHAIGAQSLSQADPDDVREPGPYPEQAVHRFRVHFRDGRAHRIEGLAGDVH